MWSVLEIIELNSSLVVFASWTLNSYNVHDGLDGIIPDKFGAPGVCPNATLLWLGLF